VLRIDKRRIACHRTGNGELIALDARCTHMGCLVRWNRADQSWDCPCHGSRFTAEGAVLGGPAEQALERVSLAYGPGQATAPALHHAPRPTHLPSEPPGLP
jgi:Rieske Fe-S protein